MGGKIETRCVPCWKWVSVVNDMCPRCRAPLVSKPIQRRVVNSDKTRKGKP